MLAWLAACRAPPPADDAPSPHSSVEGSAHSAAPPPACPTFGPGEAVGVVDPAAPPEISGLVAWDGGLWAIDDGVDALLALDPTGALLGTVDLGPEVVGVDREDLARVGDRLVVADVGDNAALRVRVTLWWFDRPPPRDAVDWPLAGRTDLTWPGGPRDCETVLADPVSGDVLLVEKAFDGVSSVIRVPSPAPGAPGDPLPAPAEGEEIAVLTFGEGALEGPTLATGGAVAPDGTAVVIRTYLDAWVWPRIPDEPWTDTFGRDACAIDLLTEPQGETIAWGNGGLWTISEGEGEPVLFYPLLAP